MGSGSTAGVDEDGEAVRYDYPIWDSSNSRVFSGPVGSKSRFRGRRFANLRAARIYYTLRFGRIVQEYFVPGRYIFRVKSRNGQR